MIKDYTETPTNAVYIGSYAYFRGEVPHRPDEGLVLGQTHRLARNYCNPGFKRGNVIHYS